MLDEIVGLIIITTWIGLVSVAMVLVAGGLVVLIHG
jgi:hypothetical protein